MKRDFFTIARSLYYKWLMLSSTHKTDLSILINQFYFHLPHIRNEKTEYSSFADLFFRSIDRMIAKTQNFDLFLRRKDEQAN